MRIFSRENLLGSLSFFFELSGFIFWVLIIIGLCSKVAKADNNVIQNLPVMTCFRYNHKQPKEHHWQKLGYVDQTPIWVLLEKDNKGFLVAQPSPRCEDYPSKTCKYYWIRTVEYQDNWVGSNFNVVHCPTQLNRTFFRKYIEENFTTEFILK